MVKEKTKKEGPFPKPKEITIPARDVGIERPNLSSEPVPSVGPAGVSNDPTAAWAAAQYQLRKRGRKAEEPVEPERKEQPADTVEISDEARAAAEKQKREKDEGQE